MNVKEGLKLVFGSVVVYVVMAACASGGPSGADTSAGSSSGGAASTSGTASGSSGGGDGSGASGASSSGSATSDDSSGAGILDALTDPVPKAKADNQSGTRLKANYYAGADGSKEFKFTFHDTERNEDCSFTAASDGTMRCLPTATAASYYADAGCTQPIALVSRCAGAVAPKYVSASIGISSAFPATSPHLFSLGGATSVASAYALGIVATPQDGGACGTSGFVYSCAAVAGTTWASLVSSSTPYAVSPEISPSMFVQATTQTEP